MTLQLFNDISTFTDFEELNDYLLCDHRCPQVPDLRALGRMSDSQLDEFNNQRLRYVAQDLMVPIGSFNRAVALTVKMFEENAWRRTGRKNVVVTGPPTTGKTTMSIGSFLAVYEAFKVQR